MISDLDDWSPFELVDTLTPTSNNSNKSYSISLENVAMRGKNRYILFHHNNNSNYWGHMSHITVDTVVHQAWL